MRRASNQCASILKTHIVKKEFVPIFSYHHLQKASSNHMQMCERIRFGVSKNPSMLHSFRWNSCFQTTSSVINLIHYAEKYQCRLLIDINPMDVYAQYLWKGIRHMYPDTLLFDTYTLGNYRMCNELENVKIQLSGDTGSMTELRSLRLPLNTIVTSHKDASTDPTYATWISGDICRSVLYVPIHP